MIQYWEPTLMQNDVIYIDQTASLQVECFEGWLKPLTWFDSIRCGQRTEPCGVLGKGQTDGSLECIKSYLSTLQPFDNKPGSHMELMKFFIFTLRDLTKDQQIGSKISGGFIM